MDAAMFRDMFNLMSALIIEEVQVMIEDDGLRVKQMEESRVAMTDMFISKSYFKVLKSGEKIKEIRLPVNEVKAIMSRVNDGDVVKFTVTETGKLHTTIHGKRIREFNTPLFMPEELERRNPKVPFAVRIKTNLEGIVTAVQDAKIVDVGTGTKGKKTRSYVSGFVQISTTPTGLSIEAKTDDNLRSAQTNLTSGWDIMQYKGSGEQIVYLSTSYLKCVVDAIAKVTKMIQIELTSNLPLHLIAEMPFKGITLDYWFAPRIPQEATTTTEVEEK
jgi:ASC-1-like (ASCH) protein